MTELFTSIEGSTLAAWVRESPSIWAYATILTLHTVGLAIVVGANAVVDLRLLGWAPAIPLTALRAVFPIMWAGFAINLASGLLLFIADATTKSGQRVFWVKLACITLALIVARTIAKRISPANPLRQGYGAQEAGHHIDSSVRALAVASLLLWAGAIVAGRLMAYL